WRRNDLIAWTYMCREHRAMKSRRPRAERDSVLRADITGECALELVDHRSRRPPVRPEDVDDSTDIVVGERLAAIREHALAHGLAPVNGEVTHALDRLIIWRSSSPDNQISLLSLV